VAAIASEEDDRPIWLGEGPYVVVFDPLDGSRNIDASIPTGTIFGIYRRLPEADHLPTEEKAYANVMQRGERQVAAGYALYSSATIMAISVGSGLHGFTLDYTIGEFVYSHHDIRIPERGPCSFLSEFERGPHVFLSSFEAIQKLSWPDVIYVLTNICNVF